MFANRLTQSLRDAAVDLPLDQNRADKIAEIITILHHFVDMNFLKI